MEGFWLFYSLGKINLFKFVLISFTLTFLSACQSKVTPLASQDTAIVFIPGFYGSELITKDSQQKVWLTLSEVLFGHRSLTYNPPQFRINSEPDLTAGGLLQEISILPFLYSYKIYKSSYEFLLNEFSPKYYVTYFSYDWRDDLIVSIKSLDKFILNLNSKGFNKIYIVSHSLGAYMASYYLRYGIQEPSTAKENWYGTNKIDKAVLLTAPYYGTSFIFRNMHVGRSVGMSKSLLPPIAFSSFLSSYYLLPYFQKNLFSGEQRETLELPINSVSTWQKYKWGLFNNSDIATENKTQFVSEMLKRGNLFMRLIQSSIANQPSKQIPILAISATGYPTLTTLLLNKNKQIDQDQDYKVNTFTIGDQTLTEETQQLPNAYKGLPKTKFLTVTSTHSEILETPEAKENVRLILTNN